MTGRSRLGDCCQNHNPLTAPVVYPHAVTVDRDSLRGEYRCKCGRTWSCWWDMRAMGWTLDDVLNFAPGEWFHRDPCHACAGCSGTGCYVWNDSVTPEVHVCAEGCDGMPPGLEVAS